MTYNNQILIQKAPIIMDKKYTILIIDDQPENLHYLRRILIQEGYDIKATSDGYMAIEATKWNIPDLILLDIKMPIIDGFSVCKLLKKNQLLEEIPVIFISALDNMEYKIHAFEEGGVDYITKPFEPKEVLARVKTQLQIHQNKLMIKKLLQHQDIFIKKIMHEINTPLSIISLNSDALERVLGERDELNAIKASTKTLSSIYSDLSYLVKKESRHYETKEIFVLPFLASRISFFNEIARIKNVHINFEYSNEFTIIINEYELERIIDNTLSNAIKYSKPNQSIDVFMGDYEQKQIIKIQDHGMGIEEGVDIFMPFYQQSIANIGLGLGLTIVKEICNKYAITIDVSSQKNNGTTFLYDVSVLSQKVNN
ncbi:Response regulator PleD [Sulfurospirillum diekertiae]|uniref:histidine kinase n=2 Tax=Sulfurospirillum diekertiae TaxID=1854492 RepID=A0A290HHB4_9BACT|nr:Response regulator PleD [Sulfurospirillum diekertiae]